MDDESFSGEVDESFEVPDYSKLESEYDPAKIDEKKDIAAQENYPISKPKRVIIRTKIIHD